MESTPAVGMKCYPIGVAMDMELLVQYVALDGHVDLVLRVLAKAINRKLHDQPE